MSIEGPDGVSRQLADRLGGLSVSVDVPLHVTRRLAYTLRSSDLVYAQVDLHEDHDEVEGRIVLFSKDLVVVVDLVGLSADDEGGGDVAVAVLPRRTLARIDVDTSDLDGLNLVDQWRPHPDRPAGWPMGCVLELVYPSLPGAVVLPGGGPRNHDSLDDLIPSLLTDLAALTS